VYSLFYNKTYCIRNIIPGKVQSEVFLLVIWTTHSVVMT